MPRECLDQTLSASLDSLLADYQRPRSPRAVLAVVKDGQPVVAMARGLADVEHGVPATLDTNFRLASVSKQFTAMAVLILAKQGRLSLEEPLTRCLPGLPPAYELTTIRHLLQHTSGMLDYEDLIPEETTEQLRDRDVLALIRGRDRIFFAPGERFRYSNSGYALLALIVERASGLSFRDFLMRWVFEPAGMTHTVAHEAGVTTVTQRAYGYTRLGENFERTDQNLTSAVLGDGGIYSSITDLVKWDQALGDGRLVDSDTLAPAFTPGQLNDGRRINYGLGWQLNTYRGLKCASHSGTSTGFRNFLARFPEVRLTVIMLTNRSDPIDPAVLDRILDTVQAGPLEAEGASVIGRRIVGAQTLDRHGPVRTVSQQ